MLISLSIADPNISGDLFDNIRIAFLAIFLSGFFISLVNFFMLL